MYKLVHFNRKAPDQTVYHPAASKPVLISSHLHQHLQQIPGDV